MLNQTQEQSPKLSQFLTKMKPYFVGEPKIVGGEKVWNLKQTALGDGPAELNALKMEAFSVGLTLSSLPTPKLSLKEFTQQTDNVLLYLHESQIEDGFIRTTHLSSFVYILVAQQYMETY